MAGPMTNARDIEARDAENTSAGGDPRDPGGPSAPAVEQTGDLSALEDTTARRPFSSTLAEELRDRIAVAEDRVLLLTPSALYRFLPESEAWTVTGRADGLPGLPLRCFSLGGGNIWITGDGASYSDARFDDWQHYGPGEGYPGRLVYDVEAGVDYAYAGTDEGAARFDLYILEWETLKAPEGEARGPVSDVAVGDDYVWFALDRGVAEYRKESESFRVDTTLAELHSPKVLALRQTAEFLWAFTDAGIARYDIDLQTWTSFQAGVELPDARVRQVTLRGDDIWLGTQSGLWRYRSETGIWRLDESDDEMPGEEILAFALESGRIWVVTEEAFAVYEEESSRWIDFTSSVPLRPRDVIEMYWTGDVLVFLGRDRIVYGLSKGQSNPSLFTYRTQRVLETDALGRDVSERSWAPTLDDAGLGLRLSDDAELYLKGGGTIFVENDPASGESDFGELISDTRLDVVLTGRLGDDRTLSGFYDSTDPDNSAYRLTYRGARSDILRVISAGEIEQQIFNSNLAPGTGLTGGRVRAEYGDRTEVTRRRFLNADAWIGERRTVPARDVFYGGNRSIEGSIRDVDYAKRLVFPTPEGWTENDLQSAVLYSDDGDPSTDDANTERRTLAGRVGSWDRLRPNVDYVVGPRGGTLILTGPLAGEGALVAVRSRSTGGAVEADLTDLWLKNHYFIALEPVPGSLSLGIADSTGSLTDKSGRTYTQVFGLDRDGDGTLDAERFSPITGLLSFEDPLPFPAGAYAENPASAYVIQYAYQTSLNVFQLSHRDVVPGSERIYVDRVLLKPDSDYSFLPTSGLFIFFEHILLDEDSVIEIEYRYALDAAATKTEESDGGTVVAGQVGLAPNDNLYLGTNVTRWRDEKNRSVTTADVNARLEWKDEDRFLRITPELAWSGAENDPARRDGAGPHVAAGDAPATPGSAAGSPTIPSGNAVGGAGTASDGSGTATGIDLRGRYEILELSASHRNLGGDFASFEDRRTLLGRLREESSAWGRVNIGRSVQAEIEWEKTLSDQLDAVGIGSSGESRGSTAGILRDQPALEHAVSSWGPDSALARAGGTMADSTCSRISSRHSEAGVPQAAPGVAIGESESNFSGLGEVSSFSASVRLLRSGLPNLKLRRGRVLLDAAGRRQEKWISRAELELSPDQAGITPWGIQRLWLRAFFQRSERETTEGDESLGGGPLESAEGRRTTDQLFTRLNGTVGSPFSWNVAFEDRRTHAEENGQDRNLRRLQGLDATLHSQPHSSVDAFLRWESNRDLFWRIDGASDGFDVRRLYLATIQLYPGRLYYRLSRLSFRVDIGANETEKGEPGVAQPGGGSLLSDADAASERRITRSDIFEGRLQILSWMRFVERWERESDRTTREGLAARGLLNRLESRLEMRPTMGFIALRFIGSDADEAGSDIGRLRFLGQWDQRWGRGILTYVSLEAQRTETWDRQVGDLEKLWNPLAQITWRRSRWRLDASVGGSLSWARSEDISSGAGGPGSETKRQSLTTSLSIQPVKILSIKLDYGLSRNKLQSDEAGADPSDDWRTEHNFRLRIQIRA